MQRIEPMVKIRKGYTVKRIVFAVLYTDLVLIFHCFILYWNSVINSSLPYIVSLGNSHSQAPDKWGS